MKQTDSDISDRRLIVEALCRLPIRYCKHKTTLLEITSEILMEHLYHFMTVFHAVLCRSIWLKCCGIKKYRQDEKKVRASGSEKASEQ